MTPAARKVALVLTLLIAAAITGLSLYPLEFDRPVPGTDKTHHLIAYAALIFPMALVARSSLVWAVPAALALGVMIELVQPFTGRLREFGDVVANCLGLAIGAFLGRALARLLSWRTAGRPE